MSEATLGSPRYDDVPVASPAADIVVRPLPSEGARRMSPLNRRRWRNFRANGRGFWSFWLFLALFVASLFADFIANDRPILVGYKGELLSPVLVDYPEEKFGGFLAQTNYRDPVTLKEIAENGWAIWPPIRFSYDTHDLNVPTPAPSAPTWWLSDAQCQPAAAKLASPDMPEAEKAKLGCGDLQWHWLGTDDQVRDVAAMVVHGFRLSVLFGLILTAISSVIGVAAGAVQGYFGGWTDLIFQRGIEIWTAIPSLYLLLIIASIITPSFFVLLGILLLFSWVSLVGLVRAEFLRGRNFEYVRAARALGLSDVTIMVRHLLPNATVATLTFLPFLMNASISTLTSLDFLGFGLPPGSPSLGELLAQGKANTQAPWLGLTGFFVMAVMLSLLIFAGEAVRDAFDPRKTFG